MIRDILRTLGAACILAGTFLYFIQPDKVSDTSKATTEQLQSELDALQTKLEATQKELAHLQTASSVEQKNELNEEEKVEVDPTKKSTFTIPPGTDSATVARSLVDQGIINDTASFEIYLATNGLTGKIQIGEYDLDSTMTIEAIAKTITTPK